MSGFVQLHCHTTWSLLDGAIPAEMLPRLAAAHGYEAVAMTDNNSLLGAVRFSKACRTAGVKPIFGAELTVARPPAPPQMGRFEGTPKKGDKGYDHVTLLARNQVGYANLCRLITRAHLANERGHPSVPFEAIAERFEGLFVLSGCERGEVARLAAAGAMPQAIAAARRWHEAIGEGYRIEVFDHRGYGHRTLRNRLLRVASDSGVPAVATNDVHYPTPAEAGTHELLNAVRDIVPLSATQASRCNSEYFFKGPADMRSIFSDVPGVAEETLRIAEGCDFDLDLGSYHFPDFPIPAGETPTGLLARRCYEGIAHRFGNPSRAVEERLQHELRLIFKMGWPTYFLLVADILDHVRNVLGIRCACRGSAAASLVCYALGISDVDPVRYDLLFERFMNLRREELPDIDVDVESHRREEVLQHILDTYGNEQTAVCCMVDTFRARMAIREAGKALGLPAEEVDVVAKSFPRVRARDIPAAIARLPELKGTNLRAGQLEQLFELCLAIDGFPRHLALHPSGVILSSPDLADRVPMQESFQGFTMLQADKDDVEELGLVKLDVLGVRMLSSIAHARDEVERLHGRHLDLGAIPHDDKPTFELIRSSRTLGCFQIESPGQRELLARFQPSRFEDLIIDISLFRPGPVKSDMVSPFLERRHGFEETPYPHPRLRPILAETNGVVVYHEQVIRVIAAVTGCSMDDADYVRRHLDAERPALPDDPNSRPTGGQIGDGWVKDRRVHNEGVHAPIEISPPDSDVERWFKQRAVINGFSPPQADALWKEVFSFASFGFCKAHAAAFALPTYLSAWLKAHYPAEFLAGVLTHDPGMYPRRLIVADARNFGIPILPIDINASEALYRAEPCDSNRVQADLSERAGPNGPEQSDGVPHPFAERVSQAASASAAAGEDCLSERRECGKESDGSGTESGYRAKRLGVRLAFSEVRGISEAEIESILSARRSGGAFGSIEDLWRRTELSVPVLENLVHIGALDSIEKRGRRELLWRVMDLAGERKLRMGSQLAFSLDDPIQESLPGLPAYTPHEETEAELEISGIDARRHVMALYQPLVAEIGCVGAEGLLGQRNNTEIWVAGVKVASQTPAIRSGQRIIFVTIDDLTGPIDVTVFERVQQRCARTVFHSWLLLFRGLVRKRGGASLVHPTHPRNVGITVVVQEAFDLAELARDRKRGHSVAASLGRQRRRQTLMGLDADTQDLQPATKLWHSSGGSAGR